MKKTLKLFFVTIFGFLLFFMNSKNVLAYMSKTQSITNTISIANLYTDTFIVNHEDQNGIITELSRNTTTYFEGVTVTIDTPTGVNLTNYLLDSITVDGTGSYNIGDTFTQGPSDMTIVYTYKDILHTVSYGGDTTNYTYSNTNTSVVHNSTYTSTLTPVTGMDIDTVTVTMGGANVSNAYNASNNTITINQVTDDVQINVTTKLKTYTITYAGDTNYYNHSNNATTINHGSSFTTNITLSNNRTVSSGTVTMGGVNVPNAYNTNNNSITINNVTGNIVITIETQSSGGGVCLAEGTQITLYDGSTKNIENITYNDLLKVWNHDLGTYTYEYPTWIEKTGSSDSYTKVTFSDGKELNVVGEHRVFSKTLNKYVNINSNEFNIGDEVVSLEDGISYVTVTNIEIINENVNYYHVMSTRYFNVIANGLLTTYEVEEDISSNYKDFKEELIWLHQTPEEEKLSYEEFVEMFGYVDRYLYKTLRLEDFKYAVDQNYLSLDELKSIIVELMMNADYRLDSPTNENGVRMWMVTTSDDTDLSNESYQLEEGSIYTVPMPNNQEGFVNWYNSSDNKYYSPGDTIEVYGGMHLTAIYE